MVKQNQALKKLSQSQRLNLQFQCKSHVSLRSRCVCLARLLLHPSPSIHRCRAAHLSRRSGRSSMVFGSAEDGDLPRGMVL